MTIVMKQSRLILAMLLLFVMQLSGACVINPFASGRQRKADQRRPPGVGFQGHRYQWRIRG